MITETGTANEVTAARELAQSGPFRRFASAIKLPLNDAESFVLSIFQSGAQANVPEEAPIEEPIAAEPTPPPQARVRPSAPQARGVPGIGSEQPAPAAPAVAQGPTDMGSREMLDQLFPFG
jgi:hypothetical protein